MAHAVDVKINKNTLKSIIYIDLQLLILIFHSPHSAQFTVAPAIGPRHGTIVPL
jgi:hypothetical protein